MRQQLKSAATARCCCVVLPRTPALVYFGMQRPHTHKVTVALLLLLLLIQVALGAAVLAGAVRPAGSGSGQRTV
jgi:hypothetical protein